MKNKGYKRTFSFPSKDEIKEMRKQFPDETDAGHIMEAYKTFVDQAKSLQNVPPGPFFTARIVNRWKNRKNSTFWTSFEFVPRYLIEAVYIISIFIVGIVLWRHLFFTNIQNGLAQNEPTYLLQVQWPEETINSEEQALQFALNLNNEN
jgi:hypothetical protein